jgi:flagellar FliL protein
LRERQINQQSCIFAVSATAKNLYTDGSGKMAKDKDAAKAKDDHRKKAGDKAEAATESESEAAAKPKGRFAFLKLSRKTLLFAVAPAMLVVVLGGACYFFLFSGEEAEPEATHGAPAAAHAEAEHPKFIDVPDILVNLATTGDKPAHLKLSISLELAGGEEAAHALDPVMPRVVDQFQTYLRELRVEDLSGSAAMFRLKEELLRRVNMAVHPIEVKDVLFKEMIVQ